MLDGLRDLFLSALRGEEKADVLVRKWNAEIKAIQEIYDKAMDGERISTQPERKKGKWIKITNVNHTYACSVCGRLLVNITDGENKVTKYYPFCHCGADMREGEKE